jgi:hypothetical protein
VQPDPGMLEPTHEAHGFALRESPVTPRTGPPSGRPAPAQIVTYRALCATARVLAVVAHPLTYAWMCVAFDPPPAAQSDQLHNRTVRHPPSPVSQPLPRKHITEPLPKLPTDPTLSVQVLPPLRPAHPEPPGARGVGRLCEAHTHFCGHSHPRHAPNMFPVKYMHTISPCSILCIVSTPAPQSLVTAPHAIRPVPPNLSPPPVLPV